MSGTEDYLDGLLNSISEKDLDTKKKTGSETMQTEEDIMNEHDPKIAGFYAFNSPIPLDTDAFL